MDPTRFFGQSQTDDSAVPSAPSDAGGAQAQPTAPQGAVGAPAPFQQQAPAGQPEQPQDAGDPNGQPSEQPDQQPTGPSERERELERQLQQYQGTFSQIQNWAQQQQSQAQRQQIQQQYDDRVAQMEATAQNMSPQDAIRYMAEQTRNLNREFMGHMSQAEQQMQQRLEQERRTLGTPLWVKHLVSEAGLPAEAEQELLALGDPQLIERQVPFVKKRYETNRELQQRLDQMSRSMQAGQMVQNGAGIAGGTVAPPSIEIPADADPDTKALMIRAQLMRNAGVGT